MSGADIANGEATTNLAGEGFALVAMSRPDGACAHCAVRRLPLRRRIWRLTLDGAFYGDYRSERHALEGAEVAALTLRHAGRSVRIVTMSGEALN